jgi:hypothetical protein
MRALEENHYSHDPMSIPAAKRGRYYFECYPHPALLAVFDLDKIVKYKIHHKSTAEWLRIIGLLRSLANRELPIRNIGDSVREGLAQTKQNEDGVDAIVSAYTAAYWWKFGIERSTMIGDLATGYIVTPHSRPTYAALAKVFQGRMNVQGRADGPLPARTSSEPAAPSPTNRPTFESATGTDRLPVEPAQDWIGPIELMATDTSNIWRASRGIAINSWLDEERMEGWRLWVRFIEEDGQPAVLFAPFGNQGNQQSGMTASPQQMNRGLWSFMVADATRSNPIRFQVCYRYEQIR